MNEPLAHQLTHLLRLHALIRDGKADGPEHDAIADEMDRSWYKLAVDEEALVRKVSEFLYREKKL